MLLPTLDAHAVARMIAGEEWQSLEPSMAIKVLLSSVKPKDGATLLKMFGPEITSQVFAIDPKSEPPARRERAEQEEQVKVPDLPKAAHLSPQALADAAKVGKWLDEFVAWSTLRTPMTPVSFLESGGVWAIGLAVARRAVLNLGFANLYPHLYILWTARTSIFKKSTGMDAIADLVNEAMPHMLLPEENTPESFISALSGKQPINYDQLDPWEKKIDDSGRKFAAQRGILLDEASSLFGAAKRDYMQGMAEMLMRLYDAPPRYTRNIRSEGKIIIRNASLSILGATTPAALRRNTNADSWETGELARYALLYPESVLPYDNGTGEHRQPPKHLVDRLLKLHHALPDTPPIEAIKSETPPQQKIEQVHITPDAFSAYDAYAQAVTYDKLLGREVDPRLVPNYSRLHIQALKIALALACIDWSDNDCATPIEITLGHWARAQQIAERWRASLHRLNHDILISRDDEVETKVLDHLAVYADGETLRDLSRRTRIESKLLSNALKVLVESGLVISMQSDGGRTTIYRLA